MQCHRGEPLLREQQCDPVGEAGHDQQPQQSPSAASVPQPAPSEAVPEVLPLAFRCSLQICSRDLWKRSLYGSFLLCTSLFGLFILAALRTKAGSQILYSRCAQLFPASDSAFLVRLPCY